MSRDAKADAKAINAILWQDWDPIGCGAPDDEYESYVWPLYKLMIEGATAADIAAHLRTVASEQIGVSVPEARLQIVVDKLLALRLV